MQPGATVQRETKAEKAERIKRAKNPWEALDEIRHFARTGHNSIPEEWISTYFKWWGIYTQGDGHGAMGQASPYFMLRVGLPNGWLTAPQALAIGKAAQQYARDRAAITVRQPIQFHWVTIESIPKILDELHAVGLSSKGTSGDALRGITGCPLAGSLPDEILDTSPLVAQIARELTAHASFYNLPRKIKVSVTGCPAWCSHPEFNDLGLTAVRRGDEIGYSLRVGGGLAREPHPAVRLNAFVRQPQALDVVRAVMELFRRQEGLRQRREQARLKHLFLKQGWTADRFLAELESILGYRLDPAVPEIVPAESHRDHLGIHPQRQPGFDFVAATVPGGELSGSQLIALAELAATFGSGDLRLTTAQNLILPNVPHASSSLLAKELEQLGLAVEASPFCKGIVSCTGREFCKLGIAETKSFSQKLIAALEQRLPDFAQPLRINVTGCGNGCAHHHLADIGLEGKKIRQGGQMQDGFSFRIGGALGQTPVLSQLVGYQCTADAVPDAIERLLRGYLFGRQPGESLHEFLARSSNDQLLLLLTGQPAPSPVKAAE